MVLCQVQTLKHLILLFLVTALQKMDFIGGQGGASGPDIYHSDYGGYGNFNCKLAVLVTHSQQVGLTMSYIMQTKAVVL